MKDPGKEASSFPFFHSHSVITLGTFTVPTVQGPRHPVRKDRQHLPCPVFYPNVPHC